MSLLIWAVKIGDQIGSHLFGRLSVIESDEMTVPRGGAADEVRAQVIDVDLVGAEGSKHRSNTRGRRPCRR
jgi:hypothetical protein